LYFAGRFGGQRGRLRAGNRRGGGGRLAGSQQEDYGGDYNKQVGMYCAGGHELVLSYIV
jgi:hypothetical protein